jgi:Helix-turn-helix domain
VGAEFVRKVYGLRQEDGHPGLGGARKAVLACIAFHSNHRTARCSLKYGTIAAELGVSVSSVDKAVKWLEAGGYLTREKRHRRVDGTLGAYTFRLQPPGNIPAGPPGNTAGNHPELFRRIDQKG